VCTISYKLGNPYTLYLAINMSAIFYKPVNPCMLYLATNVLTCSTSLVQTCINSEASTLVYDLIPGWCRLVGNCGPCGTIYEQVEPYMSGALLLMLVMSLVEATSQSLNPDASTGSVTMALALNIRWSPTQFLTALSWQ